jgi:tetratricopeptide (TPR) repeat protein
MVVRLRPRDAVQWTLHIPPLGPVRLPDDAPPALVEAAGLQEGGQRAAAMERLGRVPPELRDSDFHLLQAELLLGQGRLDEALAAIQEALRLHPDDAGALALRAVIAVASNDKTRALADATRAVELAPHSARSRIVLSYAAQSAFDIPLAHDSLEAAVAAEPDSSLAWARLGEVELMEGRTRDAARSLQRAAAIEPANARVLTAQGFAALARLDTESARHAFERALQQPGFHPLAHLGLGLATIRDGDLAMGRQQIEFAVAISPDNALFRAYLGKAYLEERRNDLAGEELATAKALDPADPTPWFFDAIRKQIANRPVEALGDIEQAIARNANRAVYRSRLLLDQDLATRGASLARIYNDLGFERVGVVEAARSLALDPASASAHRFLADLYLRQPRSEIARVSALLQSQLLAPLDPTPLQPSLAISDLDRIAAGGVLGPGLNEYSPLFDRDGLRLTATGLAGSNTTLGNEISGSLQHRNAVLALGQLHSETDGFRENNDTTTNVYDVFGQWAVSPELSLQAEYRNRHTDRGDVELRFDPDFRLDERDDISQQTARLGMRLTTAPGHTFIASGIFTDRDEHLITQRGPLLVDVDGGSRGGQIETQYLRTGDWLSLRLGAGYYRFDSEVDAMIPLAPQNDSSLTTPRSQHTAYSHLYVTPWDPLTLTLGTQYDAFEQSEYEKDRLSPKLGVLFSPMPALTFRGAYYGTLKRLLAADQTVEPVQIAGFDQLYDDLNASDVDGFALGVDVRPAANLFLGAAYRRRDLHVPAFQEIDQEPVLLVDQEEHDTSLYAYWSPAARWALAFEPRYSRFDVDRPPNPDIPQSVDTWLAPLTLRWFHPDGLFAAAGASLIYQDVQAAVDPDSAEPEGSRRGLLLDFQIGYRLPGRRGLVSFEIDNILDTKLYYRDENFITSETRRLGIAPERTILGRLTLNF